MRKIVPIGTKIRAGSEKRSDQGVIVEYCPSAYCKHVYLVRWQDGTQTLFRVRKENLISEEQKCSNKQKRN